MKKYISEIIIALAFMILCYSLYVEQKKMVSYEAVIADSVLSDTRLDTIQARALSLLSTGFNAGKHNAEIRIRDLHMFINGSMEVQPQEEVKNKLLLFFQMQGDDGNIASGLIEKQNIGEDEDEDNYTYSSLAPEWAADKKNIKTDQASSLVQAVAKYIAFTNDTSFLSTMVGNKSVVERMEMALEYVLNERWTKDYGLVTSATTIDWGNVQPETGAGVSINRKTKWCADIYDNAMFVIAINNFLQMLPLVLPEGYKTHNNWTAIVTDLKKNIRKYLWNDSTNTYRAHLYLDGTPFSQDFDESKILFSGGTSCAILAGLNTQEEVGTICKQVVAMVAKEPHATVGLTAYPPYPEKEYPNMRPYTYQNGGDWGWVGGLFAQALVANGYGEEAYTALMPIIDKVLANNDFFEWWDVTDGEPKGAAQFRCEAGVLYEAVVALRTWAKQQHETRHKYVRKKTATIHKCTCCCKESRNVDSTSKSKP